MEKSARYLQLRCDGMDWIVCADYTSVLPGKLVERMKGVAHDPSCRVLKENNLRISALIPLSDKGEVLFVKRYKLRGFWDTLKYCFFPSKASREWMNLQRFREKGIPVPFPLAKGERKRGILLQDSLIVTRALPEAVPLHRYLVDNVGAQGTPREMMRRKAVLEKVADLVRRIHEGGFFCRDLHAGNILVVEEKGEEFQLIPVDFHKIWYLRKVPRWLKNRDLAQLKNSVLLSRTNQVRFLKEYMREGSFLSTQFRREAYRIHVKAEQLWRIHLKSRTRRCLVNSSEFAVLKDRTYVVYHLRSFPKNVIDEIVDVYHNGRGQGELIILKRTAKETVAVTTVRLGGVRRRVLVKEAAFSGVVSKIRHSFFPSRPRKYWIAARGLRVRGIETPVAFALVQKRRFGIPLRDVLLVEHIDGGYELNDYIIRHFNSVSSPRETTRKRQFMVECARRLKYLHERGVYHADLKSNNILVKEEGDGWKFYFIDLDRVAFKRALTCRERVNNLAQINASVAACISITDRLRFFRTYAQGTPLLHQRKKYYQKILAIGRTKVTHPYGVVFTPPARNARR